MFLDGISLRTLEEDYLGFQPYEHQYQSEELIKGENGFFCFNCSPTGSGKTLSWLKPALDMGMDVIAMYPTNALISDQVDNANQVIRDHFAGMGHEVIRITSSSIYERRQEQYADEVNVSNGKIIAHLIERSLDRRGSTIIMTNPDIFTLMMKDMYQDKYLSSLINHFEMIVVDEFHLADIKQKNSILFLLHCMHDLPPSVSLSDKFYFLSATPDDTVVGRIKDAIGIDPVVIESSGIALGRNERVKEGYHTVMPPVDMDIRGGKIFGTFEKLCGEHLENTMRFCEQGKTVIMLDGLHEVDVLYNELVDNVSGGGVERIDGFHRGDLGGKLKRFDILVSNSSVEVGIDFDVDQIIFTGYNKSSLVQRLGRLRNRESECKAICYSPKRIADHLSGVSQTLNRDQFKLELEKIFGDASDPTSFTWRYSPIEAYDYAMAVASRLPSDERKEYARSTMERINKHF
ncbi:MAG: type I-D CRISPR-associated helicase Cas3', partial [Candidatus Methanospirareceae archaeon]